MKKLQEFYLQTGIFILICFLMHNSLFGQANIIVEDHGMKEKQVQQNLVVTNVNSTIILGGADSSGEVYDGVEFRVQVRASRRAIVPIQKLAERFHLTQKIKEDFVGNWYRYSVGSFLTYKDAWNLRNKLINENGVKDAFIVAFYNGERLNSLSELKELALFSYSVAKNTIDEKGTIYRVQILAVKSSSVDIEDLRNKYGLQMEVNKEVSHNWRKYTVGRFTSFNEAKEFRAVLIEQGISDAFVVIYRNGKRITFNKRVN